MKETRQEEFEHVLQVYTVPFSHTKSKLSLLTNDTYSISSALITAAHTWMDNLEQSRLPENEIEMGKAIIFVALTKVQPEVLQLLTSDYSEDELKERVKQLKAEILAEGGQV